MIALWMRKFAGFGLLFLAVFVGSVLLAMAGELRPLDFSTEQNAQPPANSRGPSPPMVKDAVYEKFEVKIKKLDASGKKKLVESFSKKLDDAISMEQWGEAMHYKKLLGILAKK